MCQLCLKSGRHDHAKNRNPTHLGAQAAVPLVSITCPTPKNAWLLFVAGVFQCTFALYITSQGLGPRNTAAPYITHVPAVNHFPPPCQAWLGCQHTFAFSTVCPLVLGLHNRHEPSSGAGTN